MANDLVLSSRRFEAVKSLHAGFISRIVAADEFEDELVALADAVAARPSIVRRQTKRKLKAIRAGTFDALACKLHQ